MFAYEITTGNKLSFTTRANIAIERVAMLITDGTEYTLSVRSDGRNSEWMAQHVIDQATKTAVTFN